MNRLRSSIFCGFGLIVAGSACAGAATIFGVPSLPVDRIVLASLAGGGTALSNRTSSNKYEASGQTIEASALNGDEKNIGTLYLRVSDGTSLPSIGEHKIEIWIGEWDIVNDEAGVEVAREAFDVSGVDFLDNTIYGFQFTTPFSYDQNTDYAFQIWWTSDDALHDIAWDRDTGQGNIDGAFISRTSPSLTLPFDARANGNTDLYFAFQAVPEPGVGWLLGLGSLVLMRRKRD